MKKKLLHILSVFVAMAISIPIANAQNYYLNTPTETSKVSYTSVTTESSKPNSNYKQAALVGDRLYTAAGAQNGNTWLAAGSPVMYYSRIWITDLSGKAFNYVSSGGPADASTPSTIFPYESAGSYYHLGPACAADDDGTLWFASHRATTAAAWHTAVGGITHCTGSSATSIGTKVGIALGSNAISERTDVMSAYGPCTSGTGYLWFAPNGLTQLERLTITKKEVKEKKIFNAPKAPGAGVGYAKQFSSNRIIWQPALSSDNYDNIQIGTIDENNSKIDWVDTKLRVYRHGAHAFTFDNREFIVYSSSKTNITVYDYTNGKALYTLTPFSTASTNSWTSHSIHTKISGNTVYIYVFVPGQGSVKYTMSTTPTPAVSNLKAEIVSGTNNQIKVSWSAPTQNTATKYKIAYSINGGAWSAEEELNTTSKTYSNQADATYKYKVHAYYSNTNTWGEVAISNNVTVVNYTNPVTNLQVQTSIASPYSAVVNWDLPTEGTPSKYAVSYSTDGGSTWSTSVETTSKSQIFSNIAPGQYIFKVVPYYNGSPGEATTQSATVYGISNPVTNITVAYDGNLGNSIVVTWNAPDSEVAPDEYQVSYTSSNGTSKNVVTKNLTYTFSDLTVGTYTFKVTPIYNGFPSEEAFSESISVAEATGFTFTTTKRWEVAMNLGTEAAPDGRSVAVSNNMMYVAAPNLYGTISYVSESLGKKPSSVPNFNSGYSSGQFGYAMDNDDAGNIIVASGASYAYLASHNGIIQFTIYPAGATSDANKVEIPLPEEYRPGAGTRADFIGAQGNLLSAEGGYVWIIPSSVGKIMRIKIKNGALDGISTWPQNVISTGVNQPVVRPLPDGRLYVQPRSNGYKIITLPAEGETVTASDVETITATGTYTPSNLLSSDMFILQGHTFHVRNDGAKDKSIGIIIKNLTEKDKEGNGDATYTPFNGINTADQESGVSGIAGYGSLVRAVKVDNYNYDVYSYSPGHGVTVYRVSAKESYIKTDNLSSLTYRYIENYDESGNKVQDIELTWVAPANATPSSYKIYRNGSLLKTVDASTLTYTDNGVTQNYTYKVVPIFTGANEDASLGKEVTTTEVEAVLYAPIITEVRNYDGYSIVEIFWQMPSYNKQKPAYYNIYRNGVLLETGMTQYNFIDDQLPKISDDVEYTYTIEAVYGAAQNNETRTSEGKLVEVKARDWGLSGYQLQEIYNIPINQALGNTPNNIENFEYYRQGHFYKGSWYISQLSDQLSRADQGISGGAVNQSGIEGTTGGVVSIKATEEADVRLGFSDKVISSEEFASAGLAIDDKGVIFMRHNNLDQLKATIPTGTTWYSGMYDAYDRRITEGALYVPDANGNYSSEPTKIIDLSALWLDNRWIDNMYFTGAISYGQVIGRSDYFNMYGDVMSAEGGFLLISPSWSHCIFKVKVANGEYVNHEAHEIKEYQSAEGQVNVKTGTENYGFRIDGRNAWMAQIRSNGYFGIHGEEDHAGEGEEAHEHETHAIFVADSRINNTGGTSIVAFNSAEGANDGETFLITPASMYSRNYGDFIVTRGTKENVTDAAADAKFMPPMPVAQMKQTNINDNIATNANGNWFHAEAGTYTGTSGEEEECVDIYQYVPGVRFAKYRLIPDLNLPVVSPTLEISTAYTEGRTEITHFNGRSTWQRPEGFATTDPDNASVWIKSYTFELLNANGEVIYSDEVPEAKDADGNIVMDYAFDYVVDKEIDNVDNCDLDFQTYTARIAVNYEFKSGEIQQSAFNYAIASNDYDAEAPSIEFVDVFKLANGEQDVWVEKDGEWVVEKRIIDNYRIELDFNAPDSDEPVSYYTLRAYIHDTNDNIIDSIEIGSFDLHLGEIVENGVSRAKYETVSQIPGTYDFDKNKAYYYRTTGLKGESEHLVVLTWHHVVDAGTYTPSSTRSSVGISEPNRWTYEVVAHYAARNSYINKNAIATLRPEPEKEIIVTGVEVIGEDNASSLQIYPIPASTEITIKAAEAINSIVIYNEAGAEVMNLVGNGDTINKVNIESLATGYYFVRVNNLIPVTIIKK